MTDRGQGREADDDSFSMAEVVRQMDAGENAPTDPSLRPLRRGEMVEGRIASIDRDGIMIEVGTKAEGTVHVLEVPQLLAGPNPPKVGDEVLAYVVVPEDREGRSVLSLMRGREERAWRNLEKALHENTVLEVPVREVNKGGLIVDIEGLRGFVPISQVGSVRLDGLSEEELLERLRELVGREIAVKVVDVHRRRNRLILSERAALQEQRSKRRDELVDQLREGETRHGRVTSVTDFGAFVDIGGADGLVHLSELSWTRVARASDVVQIGDEVDVVVVGVDRERKKIGLSIRRAQPEPWTLAAQKYYPGQVVQGTITKIAPFGAFARIEDGLEGLIHISELSDGRVVNPQQVVTEGETRPMRILRIEPDRRRLGLSLRGIQAEHAEEEEPPATQYGYEQGSGTTIGDATSWRWADEHEDER